jgi:hypothetical protein
MESNAGPGAAALADIPAIAARERERYVFFIVVTPLV